MRGVREREHRHQVLRADTARISVSAGTSVDRFRRLKNLHWVTGDLHSGLRRSSQHRVRGGRVCTWGRIHEPAEIANEMRLVYILRIQRVLPQQRLVHHELG